METTTDKLQEYRKETLEMLHELLAGSPAPETVVKTPEQLVDENIEKIKDVLKNGLDVGGIVKDIVPVREIRKLDGIGWAYVTSQGLYAVSWR